MRAATRSLVVFIGALLVFLVTHPALLGLEPGRPVMLPGWDLTRVFWADLAYLRRALVEASWPLWNPFDRHGHAFAADPQSRVFDPITWVFVGFASLLGGVPDWTTTLLALLHVGVGAVGLELYLRRLELPTAVRVGALLLFLVYPRFDKLKDQAALWPLAWSGLAMERWLALLQRPSTGRGLGFGVVASMMLVSGYPPLGVRLSMILLPLASLHAWLWLRGPARPGTGRAWRRALALGLGLAGLMFAVLAGPAMYTSLNLLPETGRATMSSGFVLASRIQPGDLSYLCFSRSGASVTQLLLFVGSPTLWLCFVAAVLGRGPRRWAVVAGLWLTMFCLALAMGEQGYLMAWLGGLPGFAQFRIPEHFWVVGAVVLVINHAQALALLSEVVPQAPRRVILFVGLGTMIWLGLALVLKLEGLGLVLGMAAFSALVLQLWWATGPGRRQGVERLGLLIYPLALALEVAIVARPVADILQPRPSTQHWADFARRLGDREDFRVADFRHGARRPGLHAGFRDWVGHRPAFTERRYHLFYRSVRKYPGLLAAMNVAYVAPRRGWIKPAWFKHVRSTPGAPAGIFAVRGPWPRLFFAGNYQVVPDFKALWRRLARPGEPAVTVIAGDPGVAELRARHSEKTLPEQGPGRAEFAIVGSGMNKLRIRAELPQAGLVVLNDAWSPRWRARVDDRPVAVIRVNGIMRGLWLPAGHHEIEWSYAADDLKAGMMLSLTAWLALAGFGLYHGFSRRRLRRLSGLCQK